MQLKPILTLTSKLCSTDLLWNLLCRTVHLGATILASLQTVSIEFFGESYEKILFEGRTYDHKLPLFA